MAHRIRGVGPLDSSLCPLPESNSHSPALSAALYPALLEEPREAVRPSQLRLMKYKL